jgi:hypothetical protein
VAHHFLVNVGEHSPWTGVVLLGQGNGQVVGQPVEMINNGPANFFVRGRPRPKVRRCSAGNTRHARQRRNAKLLVFLDEEARPVSQPVEEPVELGVQMMVLGDPPVGLLHFLDEIDDLTQDLVEGRDAIVA